MSDAGSTLQRIDGPVLAALAPLDRVRAVLLRALPSACAPLFADPTRRMLLLAGASLLASAILVLLAPRFVLRVSPIALGVAHLAADARYLVVRPGLHRRAAVAALVLAPCALAWLHPTAQVAGLVVVGAALVGRGSHLRRALVALVGALLVALAVALGRTADVGLAHLHNGVGFVAVLALYAAGRRARRHTLALTALALGLTGLVVAAEPWVHDPDLRVDLAAFGRGLSLGVAPGDAAHATEVQVALGFAFAQAAHYAVWLRVVPELARGRRGPRSFGRSYRALVGDLGRPALGLVALLALAFVAAAALVDLDVSREVYLRTALFHGPLELGVLALAFVESGAAWRR